MPSSAATRAVPSRRERVRAATVEEIKATAMALLREHGPELRFTDIARDMGMTAPALYRYFSDRDALLSALMVDGFEEMQTALSSALDATEPTDLAARIRAAAAAYRGFARQDPSRFALLFGLPNPGFAHGEHTSGPAAGATLARLETMMRTVLDRGSLPRPLVHEVGPTVATELPTVQQGDGQLLPPEQYQALLHFLASVHGFACLESFGHLDWISERARDEIFEAQVELLVEALGAPRAPGP
jgi:AcrR family transcriptional regulator